MSEPKYVLSFEDFDKKFWDIVKNEIPEHTEAGVRIGLDELKKDADEEPPRTPHKEGHLRGSGKVINVEIMSDEISGELKYGGSGVDYDVPYAHRLHEAEPGTIVWSEPDVGSKFIESKLVRHAEKYGGLIAEAIRRKK